MSKNNKQLIRYGFIFPVIFLFATWARSVPAQQVEEVAKYSVVKKIALIAVIDPPKLTVENRGSIAGFFALPGYIIQKKNEEGKATSLMLALRDQALNFGNEMTNALRDALVQAGYTVEVIHDAKRVDDDPESVDYPSLKTNAEAIINVRYRGVGLYAGQFSSNYVPRLNIDIEVVSPVDQDELFSYSIYYGADAKKVAEDQIPADKKYAYGSFDQALEKQAEVAESFRIGIGEIAALAARQIKISRD